MKPFLWIVAPIALALVGCGGSSHPASDASDAVQVPTAGALVGTWTGPYGVKGKRTSGTVTLTISPAVITTGLQIEGAVKDETQGSGTVSGLISLAPGDVVMNAHFSPDDPSPSGSGDIDFTSRHECEAGIDAKGHLILTHLDHNTTGEYLSRDDFDLTKMVAES